LLQPCSPSRTFDEGEPDEPMTAQIFEKRLKECILQLYWIYENELATERKKAKVKSRISEKVIVGRINNKLKESKAYVHGIVEGIRKKQSQN
jgi:transcription termination factor NusB